MDFCQQYETEALLRGGDEQQAREAVQRLGEQLGPNLRFRIPYLRSLAVLATWEGQREQAIGYLCEAAQLAEELELPGEQWQIQTTLGRVYEACGLQAQAHIAFDKAAALLHDLAEGIGNESLRASFLTTPSIQHVL